jgi:MraZ protein
LDGEKTAILGPAGESAATMASNDVNEQTATADPGTTRIGRQRPCFTWKYKHGVDGQGRIQFPVKWKMRVAEEELVAVVTPHGTTGKQFLMVLPAEQFDLFVSRVRRGNESFTNANSMAQRHDWAERMMGIDLDGAGRFTLPGELRKPAQLGKEALLVGCIDWFEVWNPDDYDEARRDERVLLKSAVPAP